ncbi:hypothetical protein L211DRAFT_866363 [Terfezia boudieri ATCC MYA-4762]|uniref:Uncharacterized protein n=1 Tax=Terfezia boudieri ATCC MYA-4762 TaxID=1051890 RepID=A0A3N4LZ66_9PEZI|nr:hypothetical protein L211DRAFT_866363 [Terfezia boudieri ATCC MYA-4762]
MPRLFNFPKLPSDPSLWQALEVKLSLLSQAFLSGKHLYSRKLHLLLHALFSLKLSALALYSRKLSTLASSLLSHALYSRNCLTPSSLLCYANSVAGTITLLEETVSKALRQALLEGLVFEVIEPHITRCTQLQLEKQMLQLKLESENRKLESEKQMLQWEFEKAIDTLKRDLQDRHAADLNDLQSR